MSKTVPISEETHKLIIEKQDELYKKRKFTIRIADILGIVVEKHIDEIENDLGLKTEKNEDTT